jgi:hypothetical protein
VQLKPKNKLCEAAIAGNELLCNTDVAVAAAAAGAAAAACEGISHVAMRIDVL